MPQGRSRRDADRVHALVATVERARHGCYAHAMHVSHTSMELRTRLRVAIVAASGLLLMATAASAQPTPPAAAPSNVEQEVGDAVAAVLFERGNHLYARRDFANAKKMFIESLVRSAQGPKSLDALAMLRACNERLGIKNAEHGRPGTGATGPLDPYGTDDAKQPKDPAPLDPYGEGPAKPDNPLDPYGDGPKDPGGDKPTLTDKVKPPKRTQPRSRHRDRAKVGAIASYSWGALAGLSIGLAVTGPEGDDGEFSGAGVAGGAIGAAAGVGAMHLLLRKRRFTSGQHALLVSSGSWGAYGMGLFSDIVSGVDDTQPNDVHVGVAVGSVLGTAAGVYLARKFDPDPARVAFINSVGAYGGAAGFMLGFVLNPAETEAFSVNGIFGAGGGLVLGYVLRNKLTFSARRLMRINLGVLAGGAVAWAVLYPGIADDTSSGDEQLVGGISLAGMAVGGYVAWRLTRSMDKRSGASAAAATPGLFSHSAMGGWQLGVPVPRPLGRGAIGIDVAGGTF